MIRLKSYFELCFPAAFLHSNSYVFKRFSFSSTRDLLNCDMIRKQLFDAFDCTKNFSNWHLMLMFGLSVMSKHRFLRRISISSNDPT